MAIRIDQNGELEVAALTLEEKQEIFEKFQSKLRQIETDWHAKFGPFEDSEDMTEEELKVRLEEISQQLLWTDFQVATDMSNELPLIEGLSVWLSGFAKLTGEWADFDPERVRRYFFASKPWDYDDVPYCYTVAECECPFCFQGFEDDDEQIKCQICDGTGLWEWIT